MRTHTNNFKTNIKNLGRQCNVRVVYGNTILQNEQINSATLNYNGDILKSVMKTLELDSNIDIPLNTQITFQFGLLVGSGYEYINYGTFVVNKSEKQENTNSYLLTCYDKMLYSMIPYESLGVIYPITIRNYLNAICTKLGLQFQNTSDNFVNYNKEIPSELYLDSDGNSLDYTFRDVLDELAQVTASTICINDSGKLEVRYITNTNDTIDEEFLKNVNVNFGEQYGAINTITFSRSADSDSISKSIPTNLPDDDKIEIKISDNQILNGNNRDEFIDGILNKLYGLSYYINDFASTGITYYDLCDRYNVKVGNTTYSCVMLNDEININNGVVENIHTEMPKTSKTDYTKTDKTDRKINQTYLIVDKQQGQINAVVSQVDEIEQDLSSPTNTLTGQYFDIDNALDEPLVDFSMEGQTEQDGTPTPDTPQEIHCVSGDNTIEICGKNLFDKSKTTDSLAINRKNGNLVPEATNYSSSDYCIIQPNTQYYLGIQYTSNNYGVVFYDRNKTYLSGIAPANSFTTPNNAYFVRFSWETADYDKNTIQLEKGNQSSTYEAYTGDTQLISLGDIELLKIGNYKDYIYKENDKWFFHKEIGKLVLDGSESWKKYSGTKRFYIENFTQALAPVDDTIAPKIISNYYRTFTPNQTADQTKNSITLDKNHNLVIRNVDYNDDTVANFKSWLSTHNTEVYYVLAEPTDTEIAGTLLEQLNRLMTLPLYKNMTHITIKPNDLTPIMNIEYVRDTAINSQFVRQPQLNNYYTRTETTAQIQIGNASIKQDVTEMQTTLDNNGNAISSLSSQVQNLQTSTSQQINVINQTLENGVEKLTNSLVKIDINGINTSKDNETFNTQITNKTFEVKDGDNRMGFMGFDTDKQKMLVEFPEMQTQRLTNAYHTTEKITEDGLKWSADFYVGDDN